MASRIIGSKDPDILSSIKALRREARRALQIGLETGTPVYVMKRGKIVDLTLSYRGKAKGKSKTGDRAAVVARAKK